MAETSPDGIWSPDSSNNFNWISHFATMATSIQAALNGLREEQFSRDWETLTPANGWDTYTGSEPRVRRDGNIVTYRGRLGSGTPGGSSVALYLPEWATPASDVRIVGVSNTGEASTIVRVRFNGHFVPLTSWIHQETELQWNVT